MSAQVKLMVLLIALVAIFLFSPKKIFAQVVINKFSSDNGTDWAEVYNTDGEAVNLAENNYQLRDTSTSGNPKDLDCILPGAGRYSVDWGNSLNKDGDRIILLQGEEVVDCVAYGDGNGSFCEGKSGADLEKLVPEEYGMRDPVGTGGWIRTADSTKARDSECLSLLPTPSPTPSPSPSAATYKINEVKDEDGNTLSSVKVYVDGVYLHHYTPETLTFCDGCQCDTYVGCGFGGHTIKLEKSGYEDWTKAETITAGDAFEVNPVMSSVDSDTSPVQSPTPSPSLTPSPKPARVSGATLLGKILGEEESSPAGFFPWEATEEGRSQEATESSKSKLIPKLFLGVGLVFLAASAFWLWYTKLKPSSTLGS